MSSARLVFVNGKGGVGKTTSSISMALWLASKGFNTLLVSTDPAASIGDSLNLPIGTEVIPVQGIDNLWAIEVDGRYEYKKLWQYIKKNAKTFDIERFLPENGAPGTTEMAALFRAITFLYDMKYDVIIVDTPPTGHTLDMLRLPQTLKETMDSIKSVVKSLSAWKDLITGRKRDATEARLDSLIGCVEHIAEKMADPEITQFNLVSTAEFMSLREELRAYNELSSYGIQVKNVILNKIQPANHDNCPFCRGKREQHEYYIQMMHDQFDSKGVDIHIVNDNPKEIVGIPKLKEIGTTIMQQITNLDIKKVYRVKALNGEYIVWTQLPWLDPKYLEFNIDNNVLYMTVNYGMHENVTNAMSFPTAISNVVVVNDNGKLGLKLKRVN